MGSRFGKNRALANDPFYTPVPPIGSSPAIYDPTGGLGGYAGGGGGGGEEYRYVPTGSMENLYGRSPRNTPNNLGGRYAQGLNQMPGTAPWNYGNYYLGNTTMQMMPIMLNKVAQYGQMQAMSALGNAGLLGSNPAAMNTPMMSNTSPCSMPSSCCTPMGGASMMAAATPLPVAFNPLVQGMYPMASSSPVNWMNPTSFMSALTSGPMPYRPPAYDFPSNVGMVMTIPYGTPNPMISSTTYGSSNNCGYTSSWCCSYSYAPSAPAQPMISYYPNPVPVPQPYPVPCPYSVPIPNIQQVPVPRAVSFVAPPIIACCNQSFANMNEAPLGTSYGAFTNTGFPQSVVMSSNNNMSTSRLIENQPVKGSLPVYDTTDKSQLLIGRTVTSSFDSVQNVDTRLGVTPSRLKYDKKQNRTRDSLTKRFGRYLPNFNFNYTRSQARSDPVLPPILNGYLISDSGWMPKYDQSQTIPSIISQKKRKRLTYNNEGEKSTSTSFASHVSFFKGRRGKYSDSSISEYECTICQQQRAKKHLGEHYSSSTISSLLSSSAKGSNKHNNHHHLVSNESLLSSNQQTPTLFKKTSYKSHRRHPKKIKNHSKISSRKSNSPLLVRQSPIKEQKEDQTYNYQQNKKNCPVHNNKNNADDDLDDVPTKKSNLHGSTISLQSGDE